MPIERCQYRGYEIQTRREWSSWCTSVHPTRPDLPLIARSALSTLSLRKEAALAEAKATIDQVLSDLEKRVA